jgi:perosamine synthetase
MSGKVVNRKMEIHFHRPSISDEEISAVGDVLRSGWLTTGSRCFEFEKAFREYIGCLHAVALNSGTAALHLALDAIGLKEGDTVVTSPMTFAATAEVVRYFKAKPLFVDIEKDTMNIDVSRLETEVKKNRTNGERIKAVIPVHLAGLPCDMDAIQDVARKYDFKIIEDAAHALPAGYKDRLVGTIGDITCFSFYATKNITTGEGGMAVTDNPEWAERIRIMSLHGISKDAWNRYSSEGDWYYEIVAPGYKYNMTDIAAALGMVQLGKADIFQRRRSEIALRYSDALSDLPQITVPSEKDDVQHSWHLYIIKLNLDNLTIDRKNFIEEMKARGIGTSVHFIPLHMHPYYFKTYGYEPEDFPVAFETYNRIVTLPIYPELTDDEVSYVIDTLYDLCKKWGR